MRAIAVEHETDENPARGTEPRREETVASGTEPAQVPPAMLHPGLLLGLQARAGNAAVAALIEQRRKPESSLPVAVTPESSASLTATPENSLPLGGRGGEGVADADSSAAASPASGEGDEELAALDADAEAQPDDDHGEAARTRETVTQDAQAELTDLAAPDGETPAATGGGDVGIPIEARPPPHPPDISGVDPATGLARIGTLPPGQLLSSLGSVSTAVDRHAGHEQAQLAAHPPQRPRHPGAPATVEAPASSRLVAADRPAGTLQKVREGRDVEVRPPPDLPKMPEVVTANGQLPIRDPGLELKLGPLPHLPLEGSADPAAVQQQRCHVLEGMQRERDAGQQDAAQPLDEDEIFPNAPAETLRAVTPRAPAAYGHTPAAAAAEDDEAASIIAQQEKGDEIHGALSTGVGSLAEQRSEYAQHANAERVKADAEMTQLEQENAQKQTAERSSAKGEVAALRGQWSTTQQELVTGGLREADAKTSETLEMVTQERQVAEDQAATHYRQGQREAEQARRQAEQQATQERQKAQSGGFLGAVGSAAQSLFDKAKHAVQSVFDHARQVVRGAIERAQQLATAVMEQARQTIVAAIRTAGNALTAIGDRVLAAFPTLRDRFRGLIQARIAAAEAAVNALANALRQAVQTVLNGLGAALSAAIGLMRQGMFAAVDGVRATVRGALDFAHGAVAAFGTFAVLVKDIAANPGRWITNLGAAVRDGIQNYLWIEIKTAVQGWFSDKVQQVVGIGEAVWHLLLRGGISIMDVARMAWEGLKAAIPGILIALLIEKLMSLVLPAVGAILTIIQSLQAAWASLGRILQAFDAFFSFLKHVKLGTAAPLFAKAVAAGAVAVVEFVSNFLLTRLKGAASSVSNRLRTIARSIGERLAAVGSGIAKGARAVGTAFRRTGRRIHATVDRVLGKHSRSHQGEEGAKREREQMAFSATRSALNHLFAARISKAALAREVVSLRIRYRWSTLRLESHPESDQVTVMGGFSPVQEVTRGRVVSEAQTLEHLISRYPRAKLKLQQVRDDPYIGASLKVAWMNAVEAKLRNAAKLEQSVNPYSVMVRVAASNRANFFLGPRIEAQDIVDAGGLLKYVDVRNAFRLLKPELIAEYVYPARWVRKIAPQRGSVSPADFAADAKVPGHFWSAFHDAAGAGELALKHMRLDPKDYPKGAIRFVLPPKAAAIPELHKPTAFDGMFFPKWAATDTTFKWGLVPAHDASKAGIKEGVSKTFVPISSTILHEYVPPAAYR